MLKIKKKVRLSLISLSLLSIILIGTFSTNIVATSYNMTLIKGTEVSEVSPYDETKWGKLVDDWFEGNPDKSGAKSKTTTLTYYITSWGMYNVFTRFIIPILFSPEEVFPLIVMIASTDYDQEKINSTYTNEYELWCATQAKWYFTTNDFNETANSTMDFLPIFKNPADYEKILYDYNRLARALNGEAFIKFLGYSFPILTADEFLWQLVLSGFAIASPCDTYLTTLVNALGCSLNIEVKGNVLSFRRQGTNYHIVDVLFGVMGTQTSFVVKNIYGNIVYQITTTHSSTFVYIVLGVMAAFIFGIAFIYYKKKRHL